MGEDRRFSLQAIAHARPLLGPKELIAGSAIKLCPGSKQVLPSVTVTTSKDDSTKTKDTRLEFDHVFDSSSSSVEDIFTKAVAPLVGGLFQGYNATVAACGVTRSGKTFTLGFGGCQGLVAHAVTGIFAKEASDWVTRCTHQVTVWVSFVEVYKEEYFDLLQQAPKPCSTATTASSSSSARLGGRTDKVSLERVSKHRVNCADEVMQLLCRGARKRRTADNGVNAYSSRSHAIFSITVEQRPAPPAAAAAAVGDAADPADPHLAAQQEAAAATAAGLEGSSLLLGPQQDDVAWRDSCSGATAGAEGLGLREAGAAAEGLGEEARPGLTEQLSGTLHFVDLAGHEQMSEAQNEQETRTINLDLNALQIVLRQLAEVKPGGHVAYRGSVLTRLLQETIGGNGRALLIACVSPAACSVKQTRETLRYVSEARAIVKKVRPNRKSLVHVAQDLEGQVQQLQQEVCQLRQQLEAAQKHPAAEDEPAAAGDGGYQQQLEEVQEQLLAAQEELVDKEQQLEVVQQQLEVATREAALAQQQLECTQAQAAKEQQQAAAAQMEAMRAQQQLAESQAAAAQAQQQAAAARTDAAQLQQLLAASRQEAAEQYQQHLAESQAAAAQVAQQLAAAHSATMDARQQQAAAKLEAAEVQQQLQAARVEAAKAEQGLAESRVEVAEAQQQLAASRAQASQAQQQLTAARAQAAELQQQLVEAEMQVVDFRQQLAAAGEEAAHSKVLADHAQQLLASAQAAAQQHVLERQQLQQELEQAQQVSAQQQEATEAALAALRQQLKQAQQQLAAAEAAMEQQHQAAQAAQAAQERDVASWQQATECLQQQVAGLTGSLAAQLAAAVPRLQQQQADWVAAAEQLQQQHEVPLGAGGMEFAAGLASSWLQQMPVEGCPTAAAAAVAQEAVGTPEVLQHVQQLVGHLLAQLAAAQAARIADLAILEAALKEPLAKEALQKLEESKGLLDALLQRHNADRGRLQQEVEQAEQQLAAAQGALEEQRKAIETRLQQAAQQQQQALEQQRAALQQQQHQAAIAQLQQGHKAKMSNLRQRHNATMAQLQEKYQNERDMLLEAMHRHQEAVAEAEAAEATHANNQQALQQQVQALEKQLKDSERTLQQQEAKYEKALSAQQQQHEALVVRQQQQHDQQLVQNREDCNRRLKQQRAELAKELDKTERWMKQQLQIALAARQKEAAHAGKEPTLQHALQGQGEQLQGAQEANRGLQQQLDQRGAAPGGTCVQLQCGMASGVSLQQQQQQQQQRQQQQPSCLVRQSEQQEAAAAPGGNLQLQQPVPDTIDLVLATCQQYTRHIPQLYGTRPQFSQEGDKQGTHADAKRSRSVPGDDAGGQRPDSSSTSSGTGGAGSRKAVCGGSSMDGRDCHAHHCQQQQQQEPQERPNKRQRQVQLQQQEPLPPPPQQQQQQEELPPQQQRQTQHAQQAPRRGGGRTLQASLAAPSTHGSKQGLLPAATSSAGLGSVGGERAQGVEGAAAAAGASSLCCPGGRSRGEVLAADCVSCMDQFSSVGFLSCSQPTLGGRQASSTILAPVYCWPLMSEYSEGLTDQQEQQVKEVVQGLLHHTGQIKQVTVSHLRECLKGKCLGGKLWAGSMSGRDKKRHELAQDVLAYHRYLSRGV